MDRSVWQAMERTKCQCTGTVHYCFICFKPFDPKITEFCSSCGWLICPLCGKCYCVLDDEGKRTVDEFYGTHCTGGNCPFGKGGWEPNELPSPEYIDRELEKRKEEAIKGPSGRITAIRQAAASLERLIAETIPWHFPDHGANHWKRVADNVDDLAGILEPSTQLGNYELNEKDKFILECCAYLHDIGNVINRRNHGHFSSLLLTVENLHEALGQMGLDSNTAAIIEEAVSKIRRLVGDDLELVARVSELHSRSDSDRVLLTTDITEALASGLITKREAALISILRAADSLDSDRRRVETNSQGEPYAVLVDRIQREIASTKKEEALRHVMGHRVIKIAKIISEDNKTKLSFDLDVNLLKSDKANINRVSFKMVDVIKDVETTLCSCTYSIEIVCGDANIKGRISRHINMQTGKEVN